jgi:hypothetical protein
MTEHPEMRSTEFGRVLAELLEKRGLEVSPFAVGQLAEDAGLDGWQLINRMADADADFSRRLRPLAEKLELTDAEKTQLAMAFLFEQA